jgi:hypothetical protein
VTGFTCTVNFQTVCNKRGPQTIGSVPRLTTMQQLYLMQNCGNREPKYGGAFPKVCVRVRWVG